MTKKQKISRRLRVMAEYESSGIWVIGPIGPLRHGMIKHQALGLPPELAQQFDAWITEYTSQLESPNHPLDVASFNATGRALAEALKRFLGLAYEVEYLLTLFCQNGVESEKGGIIAQFKDEVRSHDTGEICHANGSLRGRILPTVPGSLS